MGDETTGSIRFMRAAEEVAEESRFSGADQHDSRLGRISSASKSGIETVGSGKGRQTFVRCRTDVQDIGAASALQFVVLADRISDFGSSEFLELKLHDVALTKTFDLCAVHHSSLHL